MNGSKLDCSFLEYSLDHQPFSYVIAVLCCILNAIFSVTAVFGNCLLIAAIWRTPALHSPSISILFSIACGDLLNGLLAQPLFIVYQASELQENLEVLCVSGLVWNYICWLSCGTSGIGLTMLSLERFLALKLHLRYHDFITPTRIKVAAVLPWVVMATFPAIRFIEGGNRVAIIALLPLILSTLLVIAICSFKVLQLVHRHQTKIDGQVRAVSRLRLNIEGTISIRKFRKSAVVTAWVVAVYWLATIPVFCVMFAYSLHGFIPPIRVAYNIALTISSINSSANFVICYWRMREIRKAVAKIFGTNTTKSCYDGRTVRRRSTRDFRSEHSFMGSSRDIRPTLINVLPSNNSTTGSNWSNNRFLIVPADVRY